MVSILHYFYDPLCGWCYAASRLVAAAAATGIEMALHGGGLWDEPQSYPPGMVPRIRAMEAGIAQATGLPYGDAYIHGLLGNPDTILHSQPPIAAILAAEQVDRGRQLPLLAALQHAHFVEGRSIVEDGVIRAAAEAVGLDLPRFDRALADVDADAHIAETRSRMRQLGVRGFPGFVVETVNGPRGLDHATLYGDPPAFARAVSAAAHA